MVDSGRWTAGKKTEEACQQSSRSVGLAESDGLDGGRLSSFPAVARYRKVCLGFSNPSCGEFDSCEYRGGEGTRNNPKFSKFLVDRRWIVGGTRYSFRGGGEIKLCAQGITNAAHRTNGRNWTHDPWPEAISGAQSLLNLFPLWLSTVH